MHVIYLVQKMEVMFSGHKSGHRSSNCSQFLTTATNDERHETFSCMHAWCTFNGSYLAGVACHRFLKVPHECMLPHDAIACICFAWHACRYPRTDCSSGSSIQIPLQVLLICRLG